MEPRFKVGDRALWNGRPGIVAGYWRPLGEEDQITVGEPDPNVPWPYLFAPDSLAEPDRATKRFPGMFIVAGHEITRVEEEGK